MSALSTGDVSRAVVAAARRRHRAIERGDDPYRVHTIYDDADLAPIHLAGMLETRVEHRTWRTRAACIGLPPDMFFPERGDNAAADTARAVCARCPVTAACLDANLDQRDGIYGNTTPSIRRAMRRAARLDRPDRLGSHEEAPRT